ncbi:MAG: hypothetical protein Q9177_006968 [Variospora cf. flavescens]
MHYGPAVERVLAIIEKGVKDRQTINGEVLRLHLNSRAKWTSLEIQMKELDSSLEEITRNKSQQLRDSISTIVSLDASASGSTVDTPGSSPASSVVGTPNGKVDGLSSAMNRASRRNSLVSHPTSRSSSARRVFTAPGVSESSQMPRKIPVTRSLTSDSWSGYRGASPSPHARKFASTPTPDGRRPSLNTPGGRPRWNSNPKIHHNDYPTKLPPHLTPPSGRKSSLPPTTKSPRPLGDFFTPPPPGTVVSPAPAPSCVWRSKLARPPSALNPNYAPRQPFPQIIPPDLGCRQRRCPFQPS